MARQYIRKVSLQLGDVDGNGLDFSKLKIRFAVRRGDIQTPNTADIRIYNVSPDTANRVQNEFSRLLLQVGYEGNFGTIFDGQIRQVRRGRENATDTYLDITASDGDSAYTHAVVNISLAAGSLPADHVAVCADAMAEHDVKLGEVPGLPGNALPRGKVMYGMARDYMRVVARNTATVWSIQDMEITMIPQDEYLPGEIPLINAKTGMVGMPEQTQNGIKVKMLINPSVKIGQLIQIDNASIQQMRLGLSQGELAAQGLTMETAKLDDDGLYYVQTVDHTGDTRGNDYYSEAICLASNASPNNFLMGKSIAADAIPPGRTADLYKKK